MGVGVGGGGWGGGGGGGSRWGWGQGVLSQWSCNGVQVASPYLANGILLQFRATKRGSENGRLGSDTQATTTHVSHYF